MKNIKKIIVFFILMLLFILPGCFKELTGKDFKQRFDDSIYHSSVSYWYLGKKEGYHYIQERWPSRFTIYKISGNEIVIKKKLKFTLNKKDWINLKKDDIELPNLKPDQDIKGNNHLNLIEE